jgi:hypothetical protein
MYSGGSRGWWTDEVGLSVRLAMSWRVVDVHREARESFMVLDSGDSLT